LYGGETVTPFNTSDISNGTDYGFDDVYMLSLPSFQWFRFSFPGQEAYPHNRLSCNVVNDAQMLIIGGWFPNDTTIQNCDAQKVAGVHNLNLSGPAWNAFVPNVTEYMVPSIIVDAIGGG